MALESRICAVGAGGATASIALESFEAFSFRVGGATASTVSVADPDSETASAGLVVGLAGVEFAVFCGL